MGRLEIISGGSTVACYCARFFVRTLVFYILKLLDMKKVIEKAKQYESKKSLDGKMKFLKGNVKLPAKKKK
jgi:hypothetical protein